MGLKVNAIAKKVTLRPERVLYMGLGSFVLALLWNWYFEHKLSGRRLKLFDMAFAIRSLPLSRMLCENKNIHYALLAAMGITIVLMPHFSSLYQTNIMISAFLYIILGLGLNIVVGFAGQLVLGYIGFYAVGAYTYGILYSQFGIGFWTALPLGGLAAAIFGLLLGFPVLRLRGDYLAIVTLGFGEIMRLTLQNMNITGGSRGIANIARPGFFGVEFSLSNATIYIYYLVFAAVLITLAVVIRLKNSRIGLALQALREDEIACEAMGIDLTRLKLLTFSLSACWAGFAGVIFAAKTTFINPPSFTFMESAMVLSIVVLGGMGSTTGVVLGAFILILTPEYLRAFSEYRMLIFGAVMVLMMIFRPQGLLAPAKRAYRIKDHEDKA
jgi:branched-chain amino acid transport system permease protein